MLQDPDLPKDASNSATLLSVALGLAKEALAKKGLEMPAHIVFIVCLATFKPKMNTQLASLALVGPVEKWLPSTE